MLRKLLVFLFLFSSPAFAAVTSYDNSFVANDVYSSDFATKLNQNFTRSLTGGINSISTANIVNDTITEADMADDANPRIRTYEGAGCEFVYTGLLPATDSDLTSDISAGTAYPRGYRVTKASGTAHTYTASKWTYVDIDQDGNFQYSEVAIGAAAPSVYSNSIRLARVSTDTATINTVSDLRKTSCANGPFSVIWDVTSEATLDDVLKNGAYVRRSSTAGRTPMGLAHGAFVSWDAHTSFTVTPGCLYINGKYRCKSTATTVPNTADDPTNLVSGIDTGAVGASTRYYVYGVADADATKDYSVTYSATSTAPAGVTNSRLIGTILTDASSLFTSRDVTTVHGIADRELIGGWVNFTASTATINNSYNVSSITSHGAGDFTVTWDVDFNGANYAASGWCYIGGSVAIWTAEGTGAPAAGSFRSMCRVNGGSATNGDPTMVMAIGDTRK